MPAIVALMADDPFGAQREAPGDPAYARAFAAMQAQGGNREIVAEEKGEIVGCLQLLLIPGLSFRGATRAQIESVRVAADRRSHGIGGRMVAFAVEEARAAGARLVQLTSHGARADAHRFWTTCGFEHTHAGFKLMLREGA